MEELTASLAGSFCLSSVPNSTAAPHPRFAQYKCKTEFASQSERRRRYLELQKQKRFDFASYVRCLADNTWDAADDDEFLDDSSEDMDIDNEQLRKPGRYFRNQLMLSEWMLDVPETFADDWLMVPCPVGRRSLVVAANGSTKAYARNGYQLNSFPSSLPGGCRRGHHSRADHSVLDCIYSELQRTYYVLDLMCWASYPIYDSETEFRFFWLETKLQETPDILHTSRINPLIAKTVKELKEKMYRFEMLPRIPCTKEALNSFINGNIPFELDGLLFYHKNTHYTFGPSPLVVWLKAYMLPEILGISVPAELSIVPSTYAGFTAHIESVRQRKHEQQARDEKAQCLSASQSESNSASDGVSPAAADAESLVRVMDRDECVDDASHQPAVVPL